MMNLCPKCDAIMWEENCVNPDCEGNHNAERRVLAEMEAALNGEGNDEHEAMFV